MRRALGALLALALLAPAPASAVPDCKRYPEARVIADGMGTLESAIMDPRGRLLFTGDGALMRMEAPGSEPEVVVGGVTGPGGLAFGLDGFLYMGFGDTIAIGAQGDVDPQAGLLRIDPETGESTTFAEGLSMANGVVRGPDGAFYASNDIVGGIDRISPEGAVEHRWADVVSANGLVVDRAKAHLLSAQTFTTAGIARVDLDDPARTENYFTAPPEDAGAGLDGMVRDRRDRLYVAANGAGEIWRVNREPEACSLASMPGFPAGPSALTFGRGKRGFDRSNLYVVNFAGEVIELAGVRGPRRKN
ncbi:MAG TPA: SMP-30/gluconolactonase/LRE family protein [Solirubrobacterales bacterium]